MQGVFECWISPFRAEQGVCPRFHVPLPSVHPREGGDPGFGPTAGAKSSRGSFSQSRCSSNLGPRLRGDARVFSSASNKRSAIQARSTKQLIYSEIKPEPAPSARRRKNHPHTTQVPPHREARSAGEPKRRRERMERGPSVRAVGAGPDRGPPEGHPAGVEDRGGYPGRSRDRDRRPTCPPEALR